MCFGAWLREAEGVAAVLPQTYTHTQTRAAAAHGTDGITAG